MTTGLSRRYLQALRTEWTELGRWGRLALAGIVLSVIITLALGFSIPRSAKRHLMHGQSEILASVVEDLQAAGLVTRDGQEPTTTAEFDQQVRVRLLGGATIRVKIWSLGGVVVYSDEPTLIGESFSFNRLAEAALDGGIEFGISDVSEPAHLLERGLGELIEYYIPVADGQGVYGLFEVEQQAVTVNATTARISRNTWVSIGVGLGLLTVFMVSLTLANAHVLTRRRRQAENLLGEMVEVQENERRRIVGALHDDVGQPLYRLLYGLQGSRSRLDSADPVAAELARLEEIVRDVDATLRNELEGLQSSLAQDLGLAAALESLAETTRSETKLEVEVDIDLADQLGPAPLAAMFRAAQEGITNVRKHAEADHLWLRLRSHGSQIVLEVEDDGNGEVGERGLGLTTTRERLESIGGGLDVDQPRDRGTILRAWVPRDGAVNK